MTLALTYREIFSEGGVDLSEKYAEKLASYHDELVRWNERVSLTALKTPDEIAVKLFYDSAVAAPLFAPRDRIIDVGTGPGFPGMVLAILREDIQVVLAESRAKKVSFLKRIQYLTRTENVEIWGRRVEKGGPQSGHFDAVTAKATAPPEEILRLSASLLRPGGRVVLFSGKKPASLGVFSLEETISYRLPRGFGERTMQVFRMKGT